MPTPPRMLTHDGRTQSIDRWADETGIPANTIRARIDHLGWDVARALTVPPDRRFRKGGRPRADAARPTPKLRKSADGRAYVRWRSLGVDRSRHFGGWASKAAADGYRRFAAEWAAGGYVAADTPGGVGVAEVLAAWLDWCGKEYRKNGRPTDEVAVCRAAARRLNDLYGDLPAAELTPARFRAYRSGLLAGGLSRATVNHYCGRVVRCYRWAVGQGMVPHPVYDSLRCVERVKPGRVGSAERPRRQPVTADVVDRTLTELGRVPAGRVVAAMVRVQSLTGMRPGEVCAMTWDRIDRTADPWVYTVAAPKNLHRGEACRRYYLGPAAQAVLTPFLDSPAAVFGYQRGSRGWCKITRNGYYHVIARACRRGKLPHWSPHQLRHALATAVAEKYASAEAAAAAIGDSLATARRVYVHTDPADDARRKIASEMG